MLYVTNTGTLLSDGYESYYLRGKSAEYVPISVIDGYGEITITALPNDCVTLKVNDIKCEAIYTSYYVKQQ